MPARATRTSVLDGKTRTMEFALYEQDEFDRIMFAYKEGKIATLEEAFPKLTYKALEFLKTGTMPWEWDANE